MPKACHGKKRQAKVLRQPDRKINNSEEKISGNSQINLNATSQNCAHLAGSVTTQTIALDQYIQLVHSNVSAAIKQFIFLAFLLQTFDRKDNVRTNKIGEVLR